MTIEEFIKILDEILKDVQILEARGPFGPIRLHHDLILRDDLVKKIEEIKGRL